MMSSSRETCGERVYWWDGEYEGECELPKGHQGPHFDGLSWFDDDGEPVDEPPGLSHRRTHDAGR